MKEGAKIYKLAEKLFPYNRSLAGKDNLKTLIELKKIFKNLKIKKIKTNQRVFDWKVPYEWEVKSAKLKSLNGEEIINFKDNNLHLVSHSIKINKIVSLKELKEHLFYNKKLPNAIPYRTTYYNKNWGFCLTYKQFKRLKDKRYKVEIDTAFKKGNMHYGEVLIKGKNKKEVFFSTNVCKPLPRRSDLTAHGHFGLQIPENLGPSPRPLTRLKALALELTC